MLLLAGKKYDKVQSCEEEDLLWHINADSVLCHESKIYVLPAGGAQGSILQSHHDNPLAGHFSHKRTLELIWCQYYWPGIAKDTHSYVTSCDMCQCIKVMWHKPHGELQSLPLPEGVFVEITMDFITDLPLYTQHGHTYNSILIVVNRYTKLVHYYQT